VRAYNGRVSLEKNNILRHAQPVHSTSTLVSITTQSERMHIDACDQTTNRRSVCVDEFRIVGVGARAALKDGCGRIVLMIGGTHTTRPEYKAIATAIVQCILHQLRRREGADTVMQEVALNASIGPVCVLPSGACHVVASDQRVVFARIRPAYSSRNLRVATRRQNHFLSCARLGQLAR
jgi:hypothetical protein